LTDKTTLTEDDLQKIRDIVRSEMEAVIKDLLLAFSTKAEKLLTKIEQETQGR